MPDDDADMAGPAAAPEQCDIESERRPVDGQPKRRGLSTADQRRDFSPCSSVSVFIKSVLFMGNAPITM